MYVDADGRFLEGHGHDQVGGLAADARQLAEPINRVGYHAATLTVEHRRQLLEMLGLGAKETDRICASSWWMKDFKIKYSNMTQSE